MKTVALSLTGISIVLGCVIAWPDHRHESSSARVFRDAPLSLWMPISAASPRGADQLVK